ncbi:ABC transporter substrate-binding protein, partial [Pseudomonas aeruginosa]|nr:ABC transporter substrate-binding protein [Pseudomonas aeruginosa]
LQSYRMHCIYGGQLPVPVESMDRVLDEMVRDGSIERLLENSLRAPQEP